MTDTLREKVAQLVATGREIWEYRHYLVEEGIPLSPVIPTDNDHIVADRIIALVQGDEGDVVCDVMLTPKRGQLAEVDYGYIWPPSVELDGRVSAYDYAVHLTVRRVKDGSE